MAKTISGKLKRYEIRKQELETQLLSLKAKPNDIAAGQAIKNVVSAINIYESKIYQLRSKRHDYH